MQNNRAVQESLAEDIKKQFYDIVLIPLNHSSRSAVRQKLISLIDTIRQTISKYYFEDDLLLKLFEIYEYAMNYKKGMKLPSLAYRLSA